MILIKDRHLTTTANTIPTGNTGKYDTYKGSTLMPSLLKSSDFFKSGKYDTYKGSTQSETFSFSD